MRDREHLAALGFRQALRGTGALLAGALRDQLADAGAVEGLRLAHMPPEHILQFTETAEAEPLAQPGERGRVHAVVGRELRDALHGRLPRARQHVDEHRERALAHALATARRALALDAAMQFLEAPRRVRRDDAGRTHDA